MTTSYASARGRNQLQRVGQEAFVGAATVIVHDDRSRAWCSGASIKSRHQLHRVGQEADAGAAAVIVHDGRSSDVEHR